jgi:opacity protein-like surface antigen
MNIKSLLLGSAAALVAVSGARAADAVEVVAEPEPMEYVRVCDTYGTGFYYIPGTETCLRVGGFVRYQVSVGNEWAVEDRDPTVGVIDFAGVASDYGWEKQTTAAVILDARTETELGTLRSYFEGRFRADEDGNRGYIEKAYISLGGLTLGRASNAFD